MNEQTNWGASKQWNRGAWVAQSVKRPTLAQVMILRSMSSSPTWGSGLMAQSLEPVSDSVSPSLSAPYLLVLSLSLSQKECSFVSITFFSLYSHLTPQMLTTVTST